MADNITLNAGTGGSTLAADDVSSVWYQRVKLTDGTADSSTVIASGNGTSTEALRVTVSSDSTGVLSVDDNGASLTVDNADITTIAGAVSGTEMQVDVVAALPAGTNAIGKLAANSGVDIGDVDILSVIPGTGATNLGKAEDAAHATGDVGVQVLAVRTDSPANKSGTNGDYEPLQIASGRLWTSSTVTSISAGSNLIGNVGLGVRTTGGTTIFRSIDIDESEEQVKGTAGQVYWIHCMNLSNAVKYLKFYNATAASTTVGTTTPVLTFPIPTQGDTNGAGFTLAIPQGIAFSTAITVAATTGIADSDTGAPGANEVVINLGYA